MNNFDVIVLGTGAGSTAAHKCAAAGKKVAIIDSSPYGGTCALRGCDPKKVLVGISQAMDLSRRLHHKGVVTPATLSWKDMMQFKQSFTQPVPPNREESLRKAGITTYHGRAHFTSETTLEINGEILTAEKFILANGARPVALSIPGEELVVDSTAFLDLDALPDDILLIGGGYIAFEFGHLAARLGAKVKIVHRNEWPLQNFEADLVKLLVKISQDLGIEVILNTEVKGITQEKGKLVVLTTVAGQEKRFSTSLVVHAAGRNADIADLQLEKANVSYGRKGVEVNDYMQSVSNPNVYAIGDVNDKGLPLTPVGGKEALIAASNLIKGNHHNIDYGYIPSNVFTIPALASVGLTEQEARQHGHHYKINYSETTDWFASKRMNEPLSAYKILLDQETDLILGAHLLSPHAEETINVFTVAMNAKLTGSQLRKMIFSYPTSASDIVYMV